MQFPPTRQPPEHAAEAPVRGWHRWLGLLTEGWMHLAPLMAVLLFVVVLLAAFGYLHIEETRREQEALKRDVEYGQQRLRLRLLERQEQLMRLARDIANREVTTAQFPSRAEALIAQYPELLSIGWVDARRRLLAIETRPSAMPQRRWLDAGQIRADEAESGFGLARDLRQPVYVVPPAPDNAEPTLELHVPILPRGDFNGELLVEYGIDGLLRYGIPAEVLAKYAIALVDARGRLLSGQSIPERTRLMERLPWADRVNQFESPVAPVGNGLILRAQAWRTSQGLVGSAIFWLVLVLSAMTVWMLVANWRQSRRRQQAQQALQAEMGFRRAMEDSMLTGMRALDLRGRITYVNPAFCRMTGWSEHELIGQKEPFSYWPNEDRDVLGTRLHKELGGSADPAGYQMRVKRKDGSLFDARLYVSPLVDASGKQTGWMASMTDITEPNRVRRQLAASYERFTTVLEALDASVSVAPLGSKELLFANRLYRQWFGNTTEGHLKLVLRGGTLSTTIADESLDSVDAFAGLPLGNLGTGHLPEHAEIHVEHLDKWLEVRSRYLNWVDGRLVQMVIATDISIRHRAAEQAALQAERAQNASRLITMGEMASSVAHELNQPLTAITNYCTGMISRIRNGLIKQDELLAALEKTGRQAQRAGQVIQHIRSFVKRSEPRREPSDVAIIVDQVVELAEIDLRRRQVRLTHQVIPRLPQLQVDPILIEQVLMNLIKNGADAIDAAGRPLAERIVDLRVGPRDIDGTAVIQFSVTDTGTGLAPEAFERLYEAFFSTKSEGMGIGLNLCRSIVESHHGRISAENLYNAGRIVGCRFAFWIPVDPVEAPGATHDADSNLKAIA